MTYCSAFERSAATQAIFATPPGRCRSETTLPHTLVTPVVVLSSGLCFFGVVIELIELNAKS
ncbi:hypothetical protein PTT_14801 [Pyrenophora teres f. teres 0-1]|uniref:Uncharacterized protein n=1 Tax=Pyrenophora teres f. teres (strain 0-1) TaxID=861557 RepID=E3RYX6_PYRTT|nr:hypothetical protein PTT_14801 [Pyrenophora teres f. teres 0-1]